MDVKTLARDWAALPQLSHIHASGDGRWAFFCSMGDEVEEVWAVPTDGSARPVQLTWSTDHLAIRDVSQDGMLLVLAQSKNASGHDHLMTLDRRVGNRLRLLTPKQNSHYAYGGRLTRDGGVIFVADFDYHAGAVVEGACVWWQSLTTGERRLLARTKTFFDRAPQVSPDGARVLLNVSERAPGGGAGLGGEPGRQRAARGAELWPAQQHAGRLAG